MFIPPKLKKLIAIGYDFTAIALAWLFSYVLLFNFDVIPHHWLPSALGLLPFLLAVQSTAFYYYGLYRGVWRFVSITDLIRIAKATMTSVAIIALISFLGAKIIYIPRSIPLLYGILLICLLCGGRVCRRWMKDYRYSSIEGKRTLIVGAGAGGEQLVRDLLRHTSKEYQPIVFVDDNPQLHGKEIHGIRVIGSCVDIKTIVKNYNIELILIAAPAAKSRQMRQIVAYCNAANVPFRTLPSLHDITDGKVSVSALREVSLEDLLGRDPVDLDWNEIAHVVRHKRIVVTGGGGSIGSELCRQIAKLNPEELVVIENNEFNLYKLEMELLQKFAELKFSYYLADVTNENLIQHIIASKKPHIIFHAAAYKHVPLLESQIVSSMRNNILGTKTICEAAIKNNVDKFILISTDKAVNPTNVMGATKRVAELVCQHSNGKGQCKFITVRFGNVLGSVGSVIPLFKKQLEAGGPITVTHPNITRFFMTIPEATQLILQAAAIGNGGEICVLDMGEPIKITYLAEQMIQLAGFQVGKDIEITYSGLRPGEKLYEELFYSDEHSSNAVHKKILTVKTENKKSNLDQYLIEIKQACDQYDTSKLRSILWTLVPNINKQENINSKINTIDETISSHNRDFRLIKGIAT